MKYFKIIESKIDKWILERTEIYPSLIKKEDLNDDGYDFIIGGFGRIFTNVGALLTHISAMIAALGITLIVFDDSKITQLFIFIEMVMYALLAVICLYALKFDKLSPEGYLINSNYNKELLFQSYFKRKYLYEICVILVMLTTVFFILTIMIHIFALIFHV